MTDQANFPDRYDRILKVVGGVFDSLGAWPDHPRTLESLADAVEQLLDEETEGSQRRAIRIQTLLDEQRDRARKDAAISRASERMLQQQIDAQAHELDRVQAAVRRVRRLADQWFAAGPTSIHIQAGKDLFAALEPPKESPDA
ncbi:DUF3135 domain-containing protein [Streptomyces sp. NBC_01565]|uniref:DUF3135 domain-containing protein n=1 Tax=Streptomyces sp. NBC_01565 TaxID=2975881 RepID=UPI00224DA0CC|nr:DUF3135 domain-containing protein [Streptomyces sp. NBC_01565]MCX4543809.1 DUF3135 domain-containing protein [Streptomyces sp. NBC_01565]